ncbi:glycosyltransferase family 4 protein [Sphingomonas asaccharolytica]|uniref:glycosyltransferase family 4 protein n=1 Tax=Sphingomonas asaccharolytica TaxID=40681 RepID=UPI001470AE7C|nr:glycosyltransferase [Sphingomonas asaccharolytica]
MRETPHDIVFTNSFFDKEFTIPLLMARRFGKVPRNPVVLSPRGEFSSGALGLNAIRKSLYRGLVSRLGLVRSVVFHTTSDEEERDVRAAFPANRVVRITNLRPTFPLPPHRPSAKGGPLRATFVGRISPVKGLDLALEALRLVQTPVDFTIYGPISDASHWAQCQAIIAALPAHVSARHGGELANDAVPGALAAQDLMFMPSRSENFGHAIFESLCAGTPVVIGDRTPWRGLKADRAGFDLADMRPAAFAAAIDRYAELDADQRDLWREGARRVAERFVHESRAAEELSALFNRLSSEHDWNLEAGNGAA